MELSCQETVKALMEQGHTVRILTSQHGAREATVEGNVSRVLNLEMELAPNRNAWRMLLRRHTDLAASRQALRQSIALFDPEVLFIWGMWNLPRQLAADGEQLMQGRVLYRFADYWPTLSSQHIQYWRAPGRTLATRIVRRALAPLAIRILQASEEIELGYPHAYCVSHSVRARLLEDGIPVSHATVIHSGIDLGRFRRSGSQVELAPRLLGRMLYVGRISPEKGLIVLLRALERLARNGPEHPWRLTIAGAGDRESVAQVMGTVDRLELARFVTYLGERPAREIPGLMQQHGVVVVPSLWEEPFPRTALEAMASGRLVVASRTGGLPEIVIPGRTGLLAGVGDSDELAETLQAARRRPSWSQRLASAGRKSVEEQFTIRHMMEHLTVALHQAAGRTGPPLAALVRQQPAGI
jgi:glycosyltransferase involved in cell wall biosynthesis